MSLWQAIFAEKEPPLELAEFYREAAFWHYLGISAQALELMNPRKLADYERIISLLQAKEKADLNRAKQKGAR